MNWSQLSAGYQKPLNRLYQARAALEKEGISIVDLVSGQGGSDGSPFPTSLVERALRIGLKATTPYRPDPKGQRTAREAISRYYAGEGLVLPNDHLILTPGTSLSYFYLFKLLANAGDDFLTPQPSYPLFDTIAEWCGISLRPYPLREDRGWTIDTNALEASITSRTRGIILVSPHNPTGAVASDATLATLCDVATRSQLPIISDEVFSPFLYTAKRFPRIAATTAPLVFTLNGFSKMFALPGFKIGWIGVSGAPALVERSLAALEMMSDMFLPVQEAAQGAVATLFSDGMSYFKPYQKMVSEKGRQAFHRLHEIPHVRLVEPQGGFYVTLALDKHDEEAVCLRMLKRHHLLLHPGYFYDVPGSHVIFNILQPQELLDRLLVGLREALSEQ